MNRLKVPILLLTGYLGSGKTTLLNRILSNKQGIKFAVIVNDIGEVNIDASLIQRGGIVGSKDDSLVALQNGCICCTLKMDMVQQINDLTSSGSFDYIVIEASGICEPAPIAQTICSIPQLTPENFCDSLGYLDCIVSVVDALRLQSEFACGEDLASKEIGEEDIEGLIIQQIEFCNIILLNKVSEVSAEELRRIKAIIRSIQPDAQIIECDYCDVDLDKLLNTNVFNFEKTATSAAWIKKLEHRDEEYDEDEHDHEHSHDHNHHHHSHDHDDDCHLDEHGHCDNPHHHHEHCEDEECHTHHHYHHHHHHDDDTEEYGIETFVYYRRRPFDINKFDSFVVKHWDKNIIRSKGICWFSDDYDMSYMFEQAGVQKKLQQCGNWYATAPADEIAQMMIEDENLVKDWDERVGDRMQKIVFIGQKMNRKQIIEDLDFCLE